MGSNRGAGRVLPAEELVRIPQGSDNGWPQCFRDAVFQNKKVLAPEYGGDDVLVTSFRPDPPPRVALRVTGASPS